MKEIIKATYLTSKTMIKATYLTSPNNKTIATKFTKTNSSAAVESVKTFCKIGWSNPGLSVKMIDLIASGSQYNTTRANSIIRKFKRVYW